MATATSRLRVMRRRPLRGVTSVAVSAAAAMCREIVDGVAVPSGGHSSERKLSRGWIGGVTRIVLCRDHFGDFVALVARHWAMRCRRLKVVGVGAHTGMLRVGVSFQIRRRCAARIRTVAAVASQAGRIYFPVDM